MANPITINCQKNTWVKVATNVTAGQFTQGELKNYVAYKGIGA